MRVAPGRRHFRGDGVKNGGRQRLFSAEIAPMLSPKGVQVSRECRSGRRATRMVLQNTSGRKPSPGRLHDRTSRVSLDHTLAFERVLTGE